MAGSTAFALQDAPEAPKAPEAPAPNAEGQRLKIQVVAVQGIVQVRAGDDQPWQRAKVGMELQPGWDIRTSLRSKVQFTIDGNHVITLDRLGDVRVVEAIRKDGMVKTDVGMRYGRTEYHVDVAAEEHEARIHSPSATLAIRGSTGGVNESAFDCKVFIVESKQSQVDGRNGDQVPSTFLVAGPVKVDDNAQKTVGPAETETEETGLDGGSEFGKTETEIKLRSRLASNVMQGQGKPFGTMGPKSFNNNFSYATPGGSTLINNPLQGDSPNLPNLPPVTILDGSLVAFLSSTQPMDLILTLPNGANISTNPSRAPNVVSSPVGGIATGNAIIFSNGIQAGSYEATIINGGTSTGNFQFHVQQFAPGHGSGAIIQQVNGSVGPSSSTTTTFQVTP